MLLPSLLGLCLPSGGPCRSDFFLGGRFPPDPQHPVGSQSLGNEEASSGHQVSSSPLTDKKKGVKKKHSLKRIKRVNEEPFL